MLERPDSVMFVARGDNERPWYVVVVGPLAGSLQPLLYGQCHLQIAAPAGITFAPWWLEPDRPAPEPAATEVAILLREQACANGKPPKGRVLQPTFVVREDAILVAIPVRQLENADCPGNPSYSMRLALPEPLGDRTLFDASVYPPRPLTTGDPG